MKQNRGFTLIEMLVVVGIIGILSSVLLTALGPAREKAKDSRIIQQVNQVRALAETMYNGTYDALPELPTIGDIADSNLKSLADDITLQGGDLVVVKNSQKGSTAYIMYSKLNQKVGEDPDLLVQYYCLESGGKSAFVTEEPTGMSCSTN
jgi:prepilin-type N-terminal cleavage/methylation domain-containing protein